MAGRSGKGTTRAARTAAAKRASTAEQTAAQTRAAQTRATHTTKAYSRLVSAQSRNPHAFQGSLKLPGLSAKAEATLRSRLSDLRSAKVQHALVIDAKSGQVLVDRAGTKTSVSLSFRSANTEKGASERSQAAGNVYVLSHPSAGGKNNEVNAPTFSPAEYEDIVSRAKAGSAYVVTPTGVASLRPGAGKGWPSYATVKASLERAFASHVQALQAAQARKSGSSKQLTEKLAGVTAGDVLHLAWKDVARQTGLRYSRTAYSTRKTYAMDLMEHPLSQIAKGSKTQEGRLGSGINRTIRVGDVLAFNGGTLHAEVTSVNHYKSAAEMVRKAGLSALGFDPRGDTKASAADAYERIYWYANPQKARAGSKSTWAHQGWLSFGVRPVSAQTAHEPAPTATQRASKAATSPRKGRR